MKRVTVDRGMCMGLGVCESLAPDHLELDDASVLSVLVEAVADDDLADVEEAVSSCPTGALRLVEE